VNRIRILAAPYDYRDVRAGDVRVEVASRG
jgi:hypothetical protein